MALLFSYGSNHPEQLAKRLGHPVEGVAAFAPGWMRVFRGMSRIWGGSVATLIKRRGARTYGYVARVSDDDLERLDAFEGDRYARTSIKVRTEDGKRLSAFAYLRKGNETFGAPPSRSYLNAVALTIATFWEGEDGPVTAEDIAVR